MKFLIVDDDEDSRVFLEQALARAGYDAMSATNGLEALDKAREAPPDMIISDVLMPEMDGFALCREVKADEALKNIPLVFYTATYTDQKEEKLALALGASRYFHKPMELSALMASLMEVVESHTKGDVSVPEQSLDDAMALQRNHAAILTRKLDKKQRTLARKEAEIRNLEQQFRRVIELSPDAVVIQGENGIIMINDNAATLLGVAGPDDLIGADITDIIHPDDTEDFMKMLGDAATEDASTAPKEYVVLRRDGSSVDVEIDYRHIPDDDNAGTQFAIRKITTRKRQEILENLDRLTRREREIMNMVVVGETNKVIARHLKISDKTVETHRANLMRKLGATSLAELIRKVRLVDRRETF